MNNLIVAFIFVKPYILTHFGASSGQWIGGGGQKGQKLLIPLKMIQIIFDHRFYIFDYLGQIIRFNTFWGTLGVRMGQKLPISLKVTPQKLQICTEK